MFFISNLMYRDSINYLFSIFMFIDLSIAPSLVGMPEFIAGVVVGSVLLTFCVQWKKSTLKCSMHLPNSSSSSNNRACNSDPRRLAVMIGIVMLTVHSFESSV